MSYKITYYITCSQPDLLSYYKDWIQININTDFYLYKNTLIGTKECWFSIDDLLPLSLQFPDVLFTINIYGEDQPDLSRVYMKNGRYYTVEAEISYPEFEEKKLEESEVL